MAIESKFINLHRSNGAVLADYSGWLLAHHFGNPAAEYHSVRSGVGLLDRSNRALLALTGADRLSFLQGLISNDLRTLTSGQGLYGAFLTQQGKVLGDCRVLCTDDSFILDVWEPIKQKILDHLNRYLVADEVEIDDFTDRHATFSLQGPHSEALLEKFVAKDQHPQQPLSHSTVFIAGVEIRIVCYSDTGENGFDLTVPITEVEDIARQFTAAALEYSAKWVGEEARELLRIEAGIPLYGVDVTEDNLILETGLNHAVSFNKGCYLGQEVVERIRSRGHVNKNLSGLVIEGEKAAAAGSRILSADKEVGRVTSSVYSPALRSPIALGYIHRDFQSPGTRLLVRHDPEVMNATVTQLPFLERSANAGVS